MVRAGRTGVLLRLTCMNFRNRKVEHCDVVPPSLPEAVGVSSRAVHPCTLESTGNPAALSRSHTRPQCPAKTEDKPKEPLLDKGYGVMSSYLALPDQPVEFPARMRILTAHQEHPFSPVGNTDIYKKKKMKSTHYNIYMLAHFPQEKK